eukprot:c26423_g1_i2 orf=454-1227(-)
MPWVWKACLSLVFFLSMVGFISMGTLIFQAHFKYKGFLPTYCHILHSSMATLPHYCCKAQLSDSCSPVITAISSCATLIDLYSHSSLDQCRSNASHCPPPSDSPRAWCDGGQTCNGNFLFHRCCQHSAFILDCQACYTDSFNVTYKHANHSIVAAEVTVNFSSKHAAEKYFHDYRTNATIRCLYNKHNSADIIIHRHLHNRLTVILFIISTLIVLLGMMYFLILAVRRNLCMHHSSTKVCPRESLFSTHSQSCHVQV